MNISAVRPSYSTVSFQKKPKEEYEEEDKNYAGSAVASFLIPGLGQFIKGDSDKGKRDLGIHLGIFAVDVATVVVVIRNMIKENKNLDMKNLKTAEIKNMYKSSLKSSALLGVIGLLSFVGSTINRVHSTYDAYTAVPQKLQEKIEDEEE